MRRKDGRSYSSKARAARADVWASYKLQLGFASWVGAIYVQLSNDAEIAESWNSAPAGRPKVAG